MQPIIQKLVAAWTEGQEKTFDFFSQLVSIKVKQGGMGGWRDEIRGAGNRTTTLRQRSGRHHCFCLGADNPALKKCRGAQCSHTREWRNMTQNRPPGMRGGPSQHSPTEPVNSVHKTSLPQT